MIFQRLICLVFVIYIIFNLFLQSLCDRNPPKFCDDNYIDAVLWDGLSYRLTRNQWIATYDENTRTVGEFVHKSKTDFPNERNIYYQSGYYIPDVPKCDTSLSSCLEMQRLIGLTVYTIRDSFTGDIFYRTSRNVNRKSILYETNSNYFFESNLAPKISKRVKQKYNPSVYSPNDFIFIHITNENLNSVAMIETIELRPNGVLEKTYFDINEPKNMMLITMFWWKFDNRLLVVAEDKFGFGNAFIFELIKENANFTLKPTNITVTEFFGCYKRIKISSKTDLNLSFNAKLVNTSEKGLSFDNQYLLNLTNDHKIIIRRPDKDFTFWQLIIIIVFFLLLIFSVLILLYGFIFVMNLRKLLERNSTQKLKLIDHKKKKTVKKVDFLLENYETSPKHMFHRTFEDFSCQTSQSD